MMEIDSLPVLGQVTPTNHPPLDAECYTPPSSGRSDPSEVPASVVISDVAARRFPLTSTVTKNAMENADVRVAVPQETLTEMMMSFEYYNSQGELVVPVEDLPPPSKHACSPTFHAGFFPTICLPPTIPIHSARSPSLPPLVYPNQNQTLPPSTTRICKTPNCNATLPFGRCCYEKDICRRCCGASAHHGSPSTAHPLSFYMPLSKPGNITNRSQQGSASSMLPPSAPIPMPVTSENMTSACTSAAADDIPHLSCSENTMDPPIVTGNKRARSTIEDFPPSALPIVSVVSSTDSHSDGSPTDKTNPTTNTTTSTTSHRRLRPIPLPPPSNRQGNAHIPKNSRRPRAAPPPPRPSASSSQPPKPLFATTPMDTTNSSKPLVTTSKTIRVNLPDVAVLRLTMSEERQCVNKPLCSNTVPSSSSPYTIRCLACVRGDWEARKMNIESVVRKKQDKHRADSDAGLTTLDPGSSNGGGNVAKETEAMDVARDEETTSSPTFNPAANQAAGSMSSDSNAKPNLVLKFPLKSWQKAVAVRFCANDWCCRRLDERGDSSSSSEQPSQCVRCQAKKREKMKVMGVSCTDVWAMRGVLGCLGGDERDWDAKGKGKADEYDEDDDDDDDEDDDDEEEEDGMGELIPGARLCTVRWCSHIIPTKEEYKWDMCLGCRRYLSRLQWIKEGGEQRGYRRQWGGEIVFDKSVEGQRRCSSLDCGVLLVVDGNGNGGGGALSLCAQCVRRKAREVLRAKRAKERLGTKATTLAAEPRCEAEQVPKRTEINTSLPPTPSSSKAMAYPEYISLSALKTHFRTQLYAFLHQQAMLAFPKSPGQRYDGSRSTPVADAPTAAVAIVPLLPPPTRTPAPAPATPTVEPTFAALFTFTGQFSSVSHTRHLSHHSHKLTILSHIVYVRSELERASLFSLKPLNPKDPLVASSEGGFATRFGCIHSIPLEWFIPSEVMESEVSPHKLKQRISGENGGETGEKEVQVAAGIRKDIKGELDIIIAADYSHPVLPGQTTVVRFRMGVI